MGFSFGQRNLTTYSGQKISLLNDGTWSYDKTYAEMMQIERQNYVESLNSLTPDQQQHVLSLIVAASHKEINFAIQSDALDYSIARKEVELYDAKVSKDKSTQKLLKSELGIDKTKLSNLLKFYKDAADNLDLIFSLNKFTLSEQLNYLKELSIVYDIEMPLLEVDNLGIDEVWEKDTFQILELNEVTEINLDTLDNLIDTSTLIIEESDTTSDTLLNFSENEVVKADIIPALEALSPEINEINLQKEKPKEIKREQENPLRFVYVADSCRMHHNVRRKRNRLITTYPEFLCGHVPQHAKKYFKDSNLLEINTSVSKNNNNTYLQFHITIMNRDAAKNYGMITKKSLIKFIDVSGRQLNLESVTESRAIVEPETGKVIYKVQASLTKEQIKFLSKQPLDSLGIMWSTGFEIYSIYNVDVIKHQMYCVKNSKK